MWLQIRRKISLVGIICCFWACSVCSTVLADALPPRSVLVFNQSTALRPWPTAIIAGIRSRMINDPGGAIAFYVEHLNLYQFNGPRYEDSLRSHFSEKYRDKPIGVIVAIGPDGLGLAIKLRASLWPTTPVVFAAVDEQAATHGLPSGVTGAAVEMMLANMMKTARIIVPDLKRFAIVGDRFEEQIYYRHFADELPDLSQHFEFIDLMGLPVSEVRRRVAALPDDSVIFYIGITSFQQGMYAAAEVLPLITEVANRPIIVDVETLFGSGAIGGYLLTPDQIGQDAGRRVLRTLNGEKVSDIPVATGNTLKPIFDWRQLQRWKVAESRLPPGSELRFREPSMWEQYRGLILVTFAAVLAQGALIFWLLYERRRRHVAEAARRETMSDLAQVNRIATAGELSASIAHEVNQPLAGIVANANAGMRWLAAATPDIARANAAFKQIVAAGHHASDVIASVRALFKRDIEKRVPLDINQLIHNAVTLERLEFEKHDIPLRLELSEWLPQVTGDRVQLLQVILNLVRNAIEAMEGSSTRVLYIASQVDESSGVLVSIEDSGIGIDEQAMKHIFDSLFTTKSRGFGIGLSICRSIIDSHHGRLWATSTVGKGSVFYFKLPKYAPGDGWQKLEDAR